jgi:agmatinase
MTAPPVLTGSGITEGASMGQEWARRAGDPVLEMKVPRIYGSTPTLFGAPFATSVDDLQGADVAFVGIPWRAPTPDTRMGRAGANYEGTLLTPSMFRSNSLKYGGYLPELDIDVFEHIRIVDRGDLEIPKDMARLLDAVGDEVTTIIDAGCYPFTIGGNSGPSTWGVLKAIAARAGGPTAVVNFDAHHDNRRDEWYEDDPAQPSWGGSWARQILTLPNVDPERYYHFGLRGPRNDRDTFERFIERGVKRENIFTYREIKQSRKSGFDEWAESTARQIVDGAAKVWMTVDPDVFDLSSNPDFGDEPFGPSAEEVIELAYQVGRAAGREKFGGFSISATPNDAQTLHYILMYMLLYTLAGVLSAGGDA